MKPTVDHSLLLADAHLDVYYGTYENPVGPAQLAGQETVRVALTSLYTGRREGRSQTVDDFRAFVEALPHQVRFSDQIPQTPNERINVLHLEGLEWVAHCTIDQIIETVQVLRPAMVQPFYNDDSLLGTGCLGGGRGLTRTGRQLVRYLDALGMIIDLAHAHPRTVEHVLGMNLTQPVVYTHGMLLDEECLASAVSPTPNRALRLEHADEIARRGGIIGLTPSAGFVRNRERFAVQVVKACQRFGENAVVIGSDMGGLGAQRLFEGCECVHATFHTLMADLERVLPQATTARVLGGNLIDFLRRALPPLVPRN